VLPDGLRLDTLPKHARLPELGFHLPSPRLSAPALNAFLGSAGYPVPHLAFHDLRGYLSGFIDLVLEHGGRYYIVDWKSNHLGYGCADYNGDAIAGAMVEHGYHLQHLLYALALHRYLARRARGYDFARHFGGVLYLFVRGVRPSWKNADGSAAGVYFHRLAPATMTALDALFPHEAAVTA
jgi:exodeoxyribonuclease V beta subunit